MEIHGARLYSFYCYMSIPDKMVHLPPDGGCMDEHEKGVQTSFNGFQNCFPCVFLVFLKCCLSALFLGA